VLDSAVKDAARGSEIALNEYQAGTVDYTTVATAQATQLSTEESALNVKQQRLLSTVSLIGDLGGDWAETGRRADRATRVMRHSAETDARTRRLP